MEIPWIPIAALAALLGALWQAVSAVIASTDSMSGFLAAQNQIRREDQARIKQEVPAWRVLRRRALIKASFLAADELLTADEARVSKQFDREAWGWSFAIVAALIGTVAAWSDWIGSLP